jgi:AraC-like DNA-binding protein
VRAASGEAVQAGLRLIRLRRGRLSIRDVADETGIGERRLQRLFRERVGLTPKEFAQIARLHATLARIQRSPVPSWGELAAETGFADQAHMIREFRRLTGQTPVKLRPPHELSDSFNTTNDPKDRFP